MKGKLRVRTAVLEIKKPSARLGLILLSEGGRLKANTNPKAHIQKDRG